MALVIRAPYPDAGGAPVAMTPLNAPWSAQTYEWWNAQNDAKLVYDADGVSSWAGEKSSIAAAQTTLARRPARVPAGLAGKQVIRTDGVNDALFAAIALSNKSQVYFLLAGATRINSPANRRIWSLTTNTGNDYEAPNFLATGSSGTTVFAQRAGNGTAGYATTNGSPIVFGVIYDGINGMIWSNINGGAIASGNAATGVVNVNRMGFGNPAEDTRSEPGAFDFSQALIFDGVPTTQQRQEAEGVFGWLVGAQDSYPSDHPYKSAPPMVAA